MLAPVRSGFVCRSCRAQLRVQRLRREGGRRWISEKTVPVSGVHEGPLQEKREKIQDPALLRQLPRAPEADATPGAKEAFKTATERMQRIKTKHWFTPNPSEDFWAHLEESVADLDLLDPLELEDISSLAVPLGRELDSSARSKLNSIEKEYPGLTDSERWALEERYYIQKAQLRYIKKRTEAGSLLNAQRRFQNWKNRYHAIWDSHVLRKDAGWDVVSAGITHTHATEELKRLVSLKHLDALALEWFSKPWEERVMMWPNLMAAAFSSATHRCHLILQATYERGASEFYVVQDLLIFLTWWAHYLDPKRRVEVMNSLCDVLLYVLEKSEPGSMIIRDIALCFLLKDLAPQKAAQLLLRLKAYGFVFSTLTLFQFANRLARDFNTKPQCVDIVRHLIEQDKITWDVPKFMALSTVILTLPEGKVKKGSSFVMAQLFGELLALGLQPNVITYTCLMRNFCKDGRFATALQMHKTMVDRKVDPTANTYSVLLNGAKNSGNFEDMGRIAGSAMAQKLGDFVIFNDILHAILKVVSTHARATREARVGVEFFLPMLHTYAKFYKLAPLQLLVRADLNYQLAQVDPLARWPQLRSIQELPALADAEKLKPHPTTLGIMLIGYLRNFTDPFDVLSFYSDLRALVKSGQPVVVELIRATQTLVYDSILFCLVQSNGSLRIALDIVGELLRDAAEAQAQEKEIEENSGYVDLDDDDDQHRLPRHPWPSVYTWSIMLNGLMRHKFTEQAESLLKTMLEHGVQPNVVTWNTLLGGYANLQKLHKVIGTLQRLKDSGLETDDHTVRALSRLQDRERLCRKLRKKRGEFIHEARALGLVHNGPIQDGLKDMQKSVQDIFKTLRHDS